MKPAFCIFAALAISIICPSRVGAQAAKSNADSLIVYGKGFSFAVKEPAGWTGNTSELARQFGVNVVFVPQAKRSREHDVTIRIRVNRKVDENTEQDLKADMDGYRKKYPTVRFEDLELKSEKYKVFSKLFFVTDQFYEYVAYVNPGGNVPMVFSFAFSKRGQRASTEELSAFDAIIQSFAFLSGDIRK